MTDRKRKRLADIVSRFLIRQTKKHRQKKAVIDVPECEEVDEEVENLHGNTKYKQEFNDMAYRFCMLGATDKQLAEFFYVTEQTINNWKQSYPTFFESPKAGKAIADATKRNKKLRVQNFRLLAHVFPVMCQSA